MNTFILDVNIRNSARFLDNSRLHKQAVEIKQIIITLNNAQTHGWRNHPAVLQWKNHLPYLPVYGLACVDAWLEAGFNSSLAPFFTARISRKISDFPDEFHKLVPLHRSYMLSKNFAHYKPHFPEVTFIHQYSTYLDPNADYIPFQVIRKQRHYVQPQ